MTRVPGRASARIFGCSSRVRLANSHMLITLTSRRSTSNALRWLNWARSVTPCLAASSVAVLTSHSCRSTPQPRTLGLLFAAAMMIWPLPEPRSATTSPSFSAASLIMRFTASWLLGPNGVAYSCAIAARIGPNAPASIPAAAVAPAMNVRRDCCSICVLPVPADCGRPRPGPPARWRMTTSSRPPSDGNTRSSPFAVQSTAARRSCRRAWRSSPFP